MYNARHKNVHSTNIERIGRYNYGKCVLIAVYRIINSQYSTSYWSTKKPEMRVWGAILDSHRNLGHFRPASCGLFVMETLRSS